MHLSDLISQSYKTACDKGWHDKPRSVGDSLALIHSEVTEFADEVAEGNWLLRVENGKPEGAYVELADVVVRIADFFGEHGLTPDSGPVGYFPDDPTKLIVDMHRRVSQALEAYRKDGAVASTAAHLSRLAAVCIATMGDHTYVVSEKMAYNATRPNRHGGKAL